MKILAVVFCIFIMFVNVSCENSQKMEIVGKWISKHSNDQFDFIETYTLKSDGTVDWSNTSINKTSGSQSPSDKSGTYKISRNKLRLHMTHGDGKPYDQPYDDEYDFALNVGKLTISRKGTAYSQDFEKSQ